MLFVIPMSRLSDRTQERVLIAAMGEIIPGLLLLLLPLAAAGIMNGLGAGGGGTIAGFLVALSRLWLGDDRA